MGLNTHIEWCDSTLNLQMGCDGCELWNPKAGVKHCYAGTLTERYGGKKGWPYAFDKPALFPERLEAALRWPDLTGTERPEKPWLNGLPRMVFLDDMGDTFTESLPLDWLADHLPLMAESPHQWMILTKRPYRMRQFFDAHPCPPNVWPGTSITDKPNVDPRLGQLLQIASPHRWVSAEPLLGPVSLSCWIKMHSPATCSAKGMFGRDCPRCIRDGKAAPLCLVIGGGESGPGARPSDISWFRTLRDECRVSSIPYFLKQMGSVLGSHFRWLKIDGICGFPDRDPKGGNPGNWPEDLRVREFPQVAQ